MSTPAPSHSESNTFQVATPPPVLEGERGVRYVIDIVGLQKSFSRKTRGKSGGYTTIKSSLISAGRALFGKAQSIPEGSITHAIHDLTLRIPQGASVGLIGRNGSGKSTFLKLLTGIYKPDAGKLEVRGRVSALIELGAGFHPDFTGRENLFLAGVMHGLTKQEVQSRFDDIVEFAELGHVIDDPVRTYSSGMFMRLGFSIAIHTDPDILLVDEVLAVGDAGFVSKCKDRIAELRKQGKTLVLVTHDLDAVERWCDEVIWLHEGEVKDRGYPRRVIDAYRQFIERGEEESLFAEEAMSAEVQVGDTLHETSNGGVADTTEAAGARHTASHTEPESQQPKRWGSREVELISAELIGVSGEPQRVFHPEDGAAVRISYRVNTPQSDVVFGVGINRGDGLSVFGSNTEIERLRLPALNHEGVVEVRFARLGLLDGTFSFDIAVHRQDGYPFDYRKDTLHFSVRSQFARVGVCSPPHEWWVDGSRCMQQKESV